MTKNLKLFIKWLKYFLAIYMIQHEGTEEKEGYQIMKLLKIILFHWLIVFQIFGQVTINGFSLEIINVLL